MDDDGNLDLRDYADLQRCFSGTLNIAGFQAPTVECGRVFDYNMDEDVDLLDYGTFRSSYTGP